jgi:tetratricopeptide (TPR) repeat protein
MKRVFEITVAFISVISVLAAGPSDPLMMRLNKLKESNQIHEYYATAFTALANDPDNMALMDATAAGLELIGALPRAQAVCERILSEKPGRVQTEKRLEYIMKNLEKINARIKLLRHKIAQDPSNGQNYATLAAVYIGLHEDANARDAIKIALRLAPSNPIALLMKDAYKQQFQEAMRRSIAFSRNALRAYNKHQVSSAESLFQRSFTMSINSPYVYKTYATYLVKQNKLGGALRSLEEERDIQPRQGQLLEMGNVCFLLKKYNQALSYYQKEFQNPDFSPKAHYNMGLCLTKLGDKQGAKEQFDIAFKQMPKLKEMKSNTVFVRGVKFEI